MTLKIGALTKLGLFFPVVCFILVSDSTLAEQLCRDKGLQKYLFKRLNDREAKQYLTLWCGILSESGFIPTTA